MRYRIDPTRAATFRLTSMEMEVLQMKADDLSNREIARRLSIAEGTVRSHLKAASDKLCVSNTASLLLAAREHGVLIGHTEA